MSANRADADFLAREIAHRMDARLDVMRIAPRRVLDLGCGAGDDLVRLGERYPLAERIGADIDASLLTLARQRLAPPKRGLRRLFTKAAPAVQLVAADARRLPLPEASASLVWSNLMLPAVDDPLPILLEMRRVTEPGGLVMFSSLGPDTLRELRAMRPEGRQRFIDMHDLGDALLQAGFSDPVMDMEMLTLTYAGADDLFADLRAFGLIGDDEASEEIEKEIETLRRDGRLAVSIEIVQGHAWRADASPRVPRADGRAVLLRRARATP
ncbi:MAG: methyltransferase domain-containing protein [Azoarcus sp.]|jgi:malonyl-CoA O-methyltransferase|nr:methyltransferase domain-containing protein [Azoarcus sp.]